MVGVSVFQFGGMACNVLVSLFQLEGLLGVKLVQSPVDDCADSDNLCEMGSGCSNTLVIDNTPLVINTNGTSLVGVMVFTLAQCVCSANRMVQQEGGERCTSDSCPNGGVCLQLDQSIRWSFIS